MRDRHSPDRDSGFSLIEMLVVVGIIMVLAAMVTPAIGQYFRNYRIREAQQQIAAAIQRARGQAISKNVNRGVSFVIESPTRFWVHFEDDQSPARSRDPQPLDFAAPNPAQSTLYELPRGVRFAANGAECTDFATAPLGAAAFAPNGGWFRFNRLGGWCTGTGCQYAAPEAVPLPELMNDANGSLLCVYEQTTGLSRAVQVSPGGRVRTAR